jgi:hypothetical protein
MMRTRIINGRKTDTGVSAQLILAMSDFGSHTPLFSSDFSPSFSCFLCSHYKTSTKTCVIVPDFPVMQTGEGDMFPPAELRLPPIFPPFLGKVLPIDVAGEGCVQTPFISPDVGKFGLFNNH